ncbi:MULTISPECIES: GntR family transcriptional regulator [unclassified Luteococcus]|uniref:GntR family transcriptional regulator n=1 Tax=unclassified Luteococcus TaxID=2639923 RepID=UPI00313BD0E6
MHRCEPLHSQLAQDFRQRIASGAWPAGERAPSEAELVRATGASRGTVRQALNALRTEGLLVGGQGRSPRVRQAPPAQSFSQFISFSQWALAIGRTPGQHLHEMARRACPAEIASELDLDAGEPVVQLLRQRSLDGVPTMVERTTFVLHVGRTLFDFDTDSGSIFAHLASQGVDLARGRHTIDAVAADQTDAQLLGIQPGEPLLRVRRVTFTPDERPVEYSDDRYLPGRTTFTIENTAQHRGALLHLNPTEDPS